MAASKTPQPPTTIPPASLDSNIFDCAAFGLLDSIKRLIEEPPSEEASTNDKQLKEGVDIDQVDGFGCTALTWACRNGHNETLTYLLSHSSSATHKSYSNLTPLHHACLNSHEDILTTLLSHLVTDDAEETDDVGDSALHTACSRGVLNIVLKLLTKTSTNINSPNNAGVTPLHRACAYGQLAVVRKLCGISEIDVNKVDNKGETPLFYACKCGYIGVVKVLIGAGCDVSVKSKEGKTAAEVVGGDKAVLKCFA